jgi:UDP-N-acetylmuramate dehydrogenase
VAGFGDADQLVELRRSAAGRPSMILGAGSNVVPSDDGYEGLVLLCTDRSLRFRDERVWAGAGLAWDRLVGACVERGLQGVEALSGIPGTVGAAPIQNIGAYGQELAETLVAVTAWTERGVRRLAAHELELAYRSSIIKRGAPWVVLQVELKLGHRRPELRYRDLQEALPRLPAEPSAALTAVRRAVLSIRRGKSMLWDPSDPNHRSVGSFFLNPVVSAAELSALDHRCRAAGLAAPPRFPAGSGWKVPAAWLIERAGFPRGAGEGPVGSSTRHPLSIVNRGGGLAREVLAWASRIQTEVWIRFGIALRPEARVLGPDGSVDPRLTSRSSSRERP